MSADANAPASRRWIWAALLCGLAYFVIGVVTVAISRHVASSGLRPTRLAYWGISAFIFAAHIWYEARRAGGAPARTALRNALAVALGGFLLAVVATVHALSAGRARVCPQLVALVAWPVLLFVPAFLVAWAASAALAKVGSKPRAP